MHGADKEQRWFWVTLTLSSVSIVAVVFALWELVEYRFFRDVDYLTLHYLYITRGVGSSLLLAFWAAWYVLRERRAGELQLRRSRERYRGLLEASPGAVALYDSALRVTEWNAAAERLYGFSKEKVLGHALPTVPEHKQPELHEFLRQVLAGKPVLEAETQRQQRDGSSFDVQLSLIPFRELSGDVNFLEVTSDIRDRVRLRQSLLELEKLTTMGQMAAGTAHHLNTPLASMLLRVQMMREPATSNSHGRDLEELEASIHFCHQFVQRLLEFSRRPQPEKQPQQIGKAIEAVVSFLAPQLLAKRAHLDLDLGAANGKTVLADHNQLEALFLIVLSNSLDAIAMDGSIAVRCCRTSEERLQVQIGDDGCAIEPEAMSHIFEPFFTTKPPGRGTGLGLAIAANILREHGGSIRLESTRGKGTTAYIELPLSNHSSVRGAQA